MADYDEATVEKAARAIYPDVMCTWDDRWPDWEYADEQQAEFMRSLVRAVLDAVAPDIAKTARAEAWDEGFSRGLNLNRRSPRPNNPYRDLSTDPTEGSE